MISKEKRKLSDIIEARTTSTAQKNNSILEKIQKIRNVDDIIQAFTVQKTIKSSVPNRSQRNEHPDIESVNLRGWNGQLGNNECYDFLVISLFESMKSSKK